MADMDFNIKDSEDSSVINYGPLCRYLIGCEEINVPLPDELFEHCVGIIDETEYPNTVSKS